MELHLKITFKKIHLYCQYFCIKKNVIFLMQKYSASFVSCSFYTITYSEDMYAVVLHQTNISYSNEMQRMYNHVVGRAGSIPSPIYSILLGGILHKYDDL